MKENCQSGHVAATKGISRPPPEYAALLEPGTVSLVHPYSGSPRLSLCGFGNAFAFYAEAQKARITRVCLTWPNLLEQGAAPAEWRNVTSGAEHRREGPGADAHRSQKDDAAQFP